MQFEGAVLAYAAYDDVELCPGTLEYADRWVLAVAARLGIDPGELLPTTYYLVDIDELPEFCPDASGTVHCAHRSGGRIEIYSSQLLLKHELVHAIHLAAWPRRQPVLEEGLARAFDDEFPLVSFAPSSTAIDNAIQAENGFDGGEVGSVGAYLVPWIYRRYGSEGLNAFWQATDRPTDAQNFRAAFEEEFGESIEEMIQEVGDLSCPITTCVGQARAWIGGVWTLTSPDGCGDSDVIGSVGHDNYWVRRAGLLEIPTSGDYELSISEGSKLGAQVTRCDAPCSFAQPVVLSAGDTQAQYFEAGIYRVETGQVSPDDPAYSITVRPAN